ncbi:MULTISPECIES: hypothetical protein [unclassified Methanopyrus]|uniref:hypothetical protein n=1 Tax=unclassified Methanopyrus TaxID=2684913 RepID=UPI000B4A9CEE|nr:MULTISPECIES: hypothetical protein [unclassified Methanopyrus]
MVVGQKMLASVVAHLLPFLVGAVGIYFILTASMKDDEHLRRLGFLIIVIGGPTSVLVSIAIVGG